jgi:hypothetical protein
MRYISQQKRGNVPECARDIQKLKQYNKSRDIYYRRKNLRIHILFILEGVEAFAEAQISDHVERREIKPAYNVHLAIRRAINFLIELLD